MSIIDVCRKVARERNARTVLRFAPKNKSSEQRVCRSSTQRHSGTRTMLPDPNRDEHWHTYFSNFTSISFAIRYAGFVLSRFTVRPDGRTPFQYLLGTPLCMFGESVFALIRSRSASSQADEQMDQWLLVGTRCIVGEQWSQREKVEVRGTMWNFASAMDSGILGPQMTSRPDEGMPTAPWEIPTVPPLAPQPDDHVPENSRSRSARESTQAQSFLIRNRQNSWMPGM